MRFPPMDVVMSWPPPQYDNPTKRGPQLLIIELTVMPVAIFCLAARMYARICVVRQVWWDDWVMVAAGVCCIGFTVAVILADQRFGWNAHVWDVPFPLLIQGRLLSISAQTIFVFAAGFGKLSILLSYLRIAPRGSVFRYCVYASMVLTNACIIGFLTILWTQCTPPSSYWNLLRTGQDCVNETPILLSQSITTIINDFIVYILPMPTLYNLQMPVAQRIGLMALFGVGSVVVLAVCMRTYWVHVVFVETYDVTWEGFWMWVWAAVEANLGVICGCVPAMRPLLSKLSPKGTTQGSSSGYGGSSSKKSKSNGGKWSLATIGSAGIRGGDRRKGPRVSTNLDLDGDYVELDHVALRSAEGPGPDYDFDALEHPGGVKPPAPVVTTTLDVQSISGDLERGAVSPSAFPMAPRYKY